MAEGDTLLRLSSEYASLAKHERELAAQRVIMLDDYRQLLMGVVGRRLLVSYASRYIGHWDSNRGVVYALDTIEPIHRDHVPAGIRDVGTATLTLSLFGKDGRLTPMAENVAYDMLQVHEIEQ